MKLATLVKVIPALAVCLASCGSPPSQGPGYQTNPGTGGSILIEHAMDSAGGYVAPDTLTLHMEEDGRISWAGDSGLIAPIRLQQEVQDSLMSIYLRAGRLPVYLNITYRGTVTMGIRGAMDDELRQAQEVVRNAIALKTLNIPFGRLDAAGAKRFRDSFPVLFQPYY